MGRSLRLRTLGRSRMPRSTRPARPASLREMTGFPGWARNLGSCRICSYSPFNTYYILKGIALVPDGVRYGNAAAELCWSNMVRNGRGCFWENDDPMFGSFMTDGDMPPGNPSLCHPWASGVTQWLSQHTLGVSALQPGHASWAAAPFVSNDLPTVSGSVPTLLGLIAVNATWQQGGEVTVTVTAPTPGRVGVLRTHTATAATGLRPPARSRLRLARFSVTAVP